MLEIEFDNNTSVSVYSVELDKGFVKIIVTDLLNPEEKIFKKLFNFLRYYLKIYDINLVNGYVNVNEYTITLIAKEKKIYKYLNFDLAIGDMISIPKGIEVVDDNGNISITNSKKSVIVNKINDLFRRVSWRGHRTHYWVKLEDIS